MKKITLGNRTAETVEVGYEMPNGNFHYVLRSCTDIELTLSDDEFRALIEQNDGLIYAIAPRDERGVWYRRGMI